MDSVSAIAHSIAKGTVAATLLPEMRSSTELTSSAAAANAAFVW